MKIQLLEPEGFPPPALERLRRLGSVVAGPEPHSDDIDAVFTRLAAVLDRQFHQRYPRLRWIVSPTTGLDHIDVDHFAANGVEIISLRGRTDFLDNIHATAEHTLALALALIRKIPAAAGAVRQGRWDRYPHKGRELHGKKVLVYGYGRIGRQVTTLYQAFGCEVRAHDIVPGRVPDALAGPPDRLLANTDVLSIHLPLNAETQRLVDAQTLSQLPPHAILINTSRGEILDQEAMLSALEGGTLGGAAVDVLIGEPSPLSSELLKRLEALADRLVVTPHIGGFTFESLEAVEAYITDVFIQAVDASS